MRLRVVPLGLVLFLGLASPAAAQMTMPAEVYATLTAVVDKYPHTGTDDERREAMKKVVQTLRARHSLRYVWKTEHQSLIAPSKDGLGYVADGVIVEGKFTVMYIWDTISGGTRKPNAPPLVSEQARQAYVLAPEPFDWLAGDPPPPPHQPPPDKLAALVALLEDRLNTLEAAQRQQRIDLEGLREDQTALRGEFSLFTSKPLELPLDVLLSGLKQVYFECRVGRSAWHGHACEMVEPRAK
jgi:hypothetical protein